MDPSSIPRRPGVSAKPSPTRLGVTLSEPHIRPVTRSTLPQEIVNAIADLIMRRIWRPGDMIPSEKELAARFQVGRSTIREAVKSLVVLGVLEARVGEGSFVREPTSELLSGAFRWGLLLSERNLGDLVDVRVTIETECAGRAARACTKEAAAWLLDLIEQMHGQQNDHEQFMMLDNQFHIRIAQMAENAIFSSIASTIQTIVRLWYPVTYYAPETKAVTLTEHLAIARAIESGDEAGARAAMQQHLMSAGERLRTVMAQINA